MSAANTFKRKELKYLLSWDEYHAIRQAIKPFMDEDEFGLHTITSIYYDSPNYELAQKSMSAPLYKEKFRIRSYGTPSPTDTVYLEIKKKFKGVGNKRRIGMSYQDAKHFLNSDNWLPSMNTTLDQQILAEINYLKQRVALEPKVMMAYDRIAMFDPNNPEFRVTFDFNVRYRQEHLALSAGDSGQVLTPDVAVLMEVKALGGYPYGFAETLNTLQIYPGKYSKYTKYYVKAVAQQEPVVATIHESNIAIREEVKHARFSTVH